MFTQSAQTQPPGETETNDSQGETEIMYPRASSVSTVKRNGTIKVLNCEKPKAKHTSSKSSERVWSSGDGVEAGSRSGEKSRDKTRHRTSSRSEVTPSTSDLSSTDAILTERITPLPDGETLLITPLPPPPQMDKSVSVDTGLSRSVACSDLVNQPASSIRSMDQSVYGVDVNLMGVNEKGETFLTGSATLPRLAKPTSNPEAQLSHSASLPRPKDKSKARKSATKKSGSVSLLQVDSEVRER